jgi:hypothetical protein
VDVDEQQPVHNAYDEERELTASALFVLTVSFARVQRRAEFDQTQPSTSLIAAKLFHCSPSFPVASYLASASLLIDPRLVADVRSFSRRAQRVLFEHSVCGSGRNAIAGAYTSRIRIDDDNAVRA